MNGPTISCTKCHAPVPEFFFNQDALAPCPACNAPLQVEVFPALLKPLAEGKPGETILVEHLSGEGTTMARIVGPRTLEVSK